MELNIAGLVGTVATAPEPYHNIYGRSGVYALYLDIPRESGTIDRVLVLFQEEKIDAGSFGAEVWDKFKTGEVAALITEGSIIEVTGKIQTYKNTKTGRTQLFVWGDYISKAPEVGRHNNTVYIKGVISRTPIYRQTPKGRYITDIAICTPSIFSEGYYSFIPCITWGRLAKQAAKLEEGMVVDIAGRIQSREYTKHTPQGDKILTTWEVSVNDLELVETEGE